MQPRSRRRSGQYVLILTNETQVDYQEADGGNETSHVLNVPTHSMPRRSLTGLGFSGFGKTMIETKRLLVGRRHGSRKNSSGSSFSGIADRIGRPFRQADGNGYLPPWNPISLLPQ